MKLKPLHRRKVVPFPAFHGHSVMAGQFTDGQSTDVCDKEVSNIVANVSPEVKGHAVEVSQLVNNLFSEADLDSDGYISRAELRDLFSRVGGGTVQKAMSMMTNSESDGCSYERFVEIFVIVALSVPDNAYVSKY